MGLWAICSIGIQFFSEMPSTKIARMIFAAVLDYLLRKTIVIAPVRAPNCTAGW
jgi:hypothetical protein